MQFWSFCEFAESKTSEMGGYVCTDVAISGVFGEKKPFLKEVPIFRENLGGGCLPRQIGSDRIERNY